MAVTLRPRFITRATETSTVAGADTASVLMDGYDDDTISLSSSTTPDVEKLAAGSKALVAGVATLDLTSLTGPFGSVTFDGKAVRFAYFVNDNTNAITIAKGASNGYELQSTHSIVIPAGGRVMMYFKSGLANASATVKNLDLSGTGTDSLKYLLVAG